MKAKLILICLLGLLFGSVNGQNLIQGTIKPGATANEVEIWLKPNFNNSTQYLFQIGMPIAFPASALPQPTGLTVTLDAGFTSSFGNNYTVTVNPVGTATGGAEKYLNIVLVRGGAGASAAQTWTAGVEFRVLKATFTYSGSPATFSAKLADYQDGGSDGQGNFYTQSGNSDYYVSSNSIGNFYASPGNSVVGGTAAAGYAQLMAAVNAGTVSGASPLCIGGTATYSSNGDAGGSWSSTNTSVATVNASSGLVTAVGAGSTDITYTVSGVSAFKTLTVSVSATAGTVSGTSPLTIGGTATYSSNGDAGGVWSSTNTSVATVNASSGLVTAVGAGTTNITYTVNSGCGSPVSSFQALTVSAPTNAGTVSGTSPLCVGGTATYSSNGDAGGSWSSTNPSVATVNASSGLVTAIGAGNTDITYTINGVSAFKTLTVNTVPTVAPITGTTSLSTGGTTQLLDATGGGIWSSNNNSVATVTSSGLVSGVSPGSATISYAVTNGCGTTTVTTVVSVSQSLIQGTIKHGVGVNEIEVWLKPNFSNSSKYLFQIGMPIAFPASASPTGLNVTLDPGFVAAFGNNYTVTVNSLATATGGTEKYFNIVLVRGGEGASAAQTWTAGTEFKVLTASFVPSTAPGTLVKLADYQDGGSDGQGNFYTQSSLNDYYITSNSVDNFYASAGQSTVGGNATAGYAQTIASVGGCSPVSSSFSASACGSYTLPWGDVVTSSGAYVHTYQAVSGCDSVVTANVTINVSTSSTTNVMICSNQLPYSWNGNSYASAGTYLVHLTNAAGCDSAATLVLNVNSTLSSSSNVSGCGSYTLPWGGVVTSSGDYTHTYASQGGCDSVVTLHVIINTGTSSSFNASACGSYTLPWGGSVTSSGAYVHTYVGSNGCDSVVTANVVINAATSSTTNVTICANELPYVWNNNSYNAGGTYVVHLTNAVGCDSAATLVLSVTPLVNAGTVNGGSPLSIGATSTYTSTGTAGGTWSSTNESVATVNATSGLVTAVSVGTTNITYTINTGCGSPVSSFKVLTVSAAANIAVNCPGNITATGTSCSKSIATNNPTYSGPVTTLTWALSGATTLNSGATGINYVGTKTFNIGVTTVTYTVKDAGGNMNTCSFTVTLKETTKPTISCPSNITQDASNGLCSRSIAVPNPVVKDNCLVASVTWVMSGATTGSSPATGINYVGTKTFNVGTTTITYTVKDASDNTVTGSFTVKVKDDVKPTLNCPADIITSVTSGCSKSIAVPNPSFSDNCSVNRLVWAMVGATNALSPLNGINYVGTRNFNVGVTEVIYVVTDAAGNFTTSSFKVVVKDNINPVISCAGNITQSAASGKCSKDVSTPNPAFSDNCLIVGLTWKMTGATTGSSSSYGMNYVGTKTFKAGTTTVTYTVRDLSGNTSSCSYTVKINASGNCTANSSQGGGMHPGMSTRLFEVRTFPNPADHYFNLRVKSDSRAEVLIVISDLRGRVIQQLKGSADQSFRFGDRLIPGTYMVEVRQGGERVIRKVVKY